MPIVFIMYGVLLILITMKVVVLNSKFNKMLMINFSIIFLMSFFYKFIYLNGVYLNLLQIISSVILFVYLIYNKKIVYIKSLLLCLIVLIINLKMELNNYTYATFDMRLLFDCCLIVFLIDIILDNLFSYRYIFGGKFYVEKIKLYINSCNNNFSITYVY